MKKKGRHDECKYKISFFPSCSVWFAIRQILDCVIIAFQGEGSERKKERKEGGRELTVFFPILPPSNCMHRSQVRRRRRRQEVDLAANREIVTIYLT